MEKSPIRPTDDEARALANDLMSQANFAALGVLAEDGSPHVTRIGVGWNADDDQLAVRAQLHLASFSRTSVAAQFPVY